MVFAEQNMIFFPDPRQQRQRYIFNCSVEAIKSEYVIAADDPVIFDIVLPDKQAGAFNRNIIFLFCIAQLFLQRLAFSNILYVLYDRITAAPVYTLSAEVFPSAAFFIFPFGCQSLAESDVFSEAVNARFVSAEKVRITRTPLDITAVGFTIFSRGMLRFWRQNRRMPPRVNFCRG